MSMNLSVLCIAIAAVALSQLADERDPAGYSQFVYRDAEVATMLPTVQKHEGQALVEKHRRGVVLGALFIEQ